MVNMGYVFVQNSRESGFLALNICITIRFLTAFRH